MKRKPPVNFFKIDSSVVLLISIFMFVFIFPIFDDMVFEDFIMIFAYSLMLLSIFSIIEKKSWMLKIAIIIAVVCNIITFFSQHDSIKVITYSISIVAFVIATYNLIKHVSTCNNVTLSVLLQAVSGYLLIGVVGVLLNGILLVYNENAISMEMINSKFSSMVYYTFVTMTTIGFGEIVPVSATARSVSIFLSVMGQIYLTVVVAIIIGKYLAIQMLRKN